MADACGVVSRRGGRVFGGSSSDCPTVPELCSDRTGPPAQRRRRGCARPAVRRHARHLVRTPASPVTDVAEHVCRCIVQSRHTSHGIGNGKSESLCACERRCGGCAVRAVSAVCCVQEIPKTVDHTPSKTIFLYHAQMGVAFAQVTHDLHKAASAHPSAAALHRRLGPRCRVAPAAVSLVSSRCVRTDRAATGPCLTVARTCCGGIPFSSDSTCVVDTVSGMCDSHVANHTRPGGVC